MHYQQKTDSGFHKWLRIHDLRLLQDGYMEGRKPKYLFVILHMSEAQLLQMTHFQHQGDWGQAAYNYLNHSDYLVQEPLVV